MSFNCFLQMNNGSETDNVDGEGNNFLFNMTHILYQGILLCGPDIVCDKTILTNLHIPSNFSAGSLCPNCSCSEECIFDQSIKCCPDVYFKYGFLECKSMNVLNKEADVRYPVISACPIDSTFDLSSNCGKQKWGDFEQIYNPPVISKNKNIIYENEFCAICHNETNYDKLNFSLKCPQNIDVNYVSSLSALLDLAKKKKCEIKNEHPSVSNNVCSQPDKKISVCNATRNWKIFDHQIAMACQSAYDFPLGAFKNMFCTICNPPEFTTHILIENCPLNSSFGDTCLDHQTLEASFPYKNYFCLACNLGYDNVGHFNDVHVLSSIESYNEQDNLPYSITIEFLYLSKSIRNYVEQLTLQSDAQSAYATRSMITEIPKGNKMHVLKLNRYACIETGSSWFPFASVPIPHYSSVNYSINLTNLAEVGFAMTRSSSCTQGLLEPYTLSLQTNCSCTIGCVSDCCDDFALIQSWACISEKYSGYENGNTEKNHRVIDNCPYTNPYVNLCSNKTFSHFYHQVPVRVLKDEFDETFLNLFCYLCGKKYEDITEEAVTNIRPWPLRISCAKYINYKYSLSLNDLIDVILKQKSCELSFQPPANTRSCEWSCGFDVASCNVSGTWKHFDDDVLIACEHTDIFTFGPVYHHHIGYKNKFCLICNPTESKFSSQIIDSCTTAKNETLVKACTSFPQSHACMNYKNIFCQQCNDVNNELGDCFFFSDEYEQEESDYHDTDFDYIHIGETRQTLTFFTPKDFDDSYFQSQEKNTKCSYDQIFDDFAVSCYFLTFHFMSLSLFFSLVLSVNK